VLDAAWSLPNAFTGELLAARDGRRLVTPSPGPPRPVKTPAAVHPLPQGGEGWSFYIFRAAAASPGPPRLKKTPAAVHPLPQGGEGWSFYIIERWCAEC